MQESRVDQGLPPYSLGSGPSSVDGVRREGGEGKEARRRQRGVVVW